MASPTLRLKTIIVGDSTLQTKVTEAINQLEAAIIQLSQVVNKQLRHCPRLKQSEADKPLFIQPCSLENFTQGWQCVTEILYPNTHRSPSLLSFNFKNL